jgi:DNA-binding transcriptional MerR regulator
MQIHLPEGKLYYGIGEVANAFDVNVSLIRFWANEFEVLKPKTNAKGNRMFSNEDIKNLKLIFHLLKEKGFTIEGAKTYIKKGSDQQVDKLEILLRLNKIKDELIEIKNKL